MPLYGSLSQQQFKAIFKEMSRILEEIPSRSLYMNGNIEMFMKSIFGVACENLRYGPFVMDKQFSLVLSCPKKINMDFVGFDSRLLIPMEFKCTFARDPSACKKAACDALKKAKKYSYGRPRMAAPWIVHFLNLSAPKKSGPWPYFVRDRFPDSDHLISISKLRKIYSGKRKLKNVWNYSISGLAAKYANFDILVVQR